MPKLIKIHPNDNCAVAVSEIKKGESIEGLSALSDIPFGHKIALFDIAAGEAVIKYGYPIGVAIKEIKKGEHIHTHNLRTRLSGEIEYKYEPCGCSCDSAAKNHDIPTFKGYRRNDGTAAIRNDIWIIPTVGCVNNIAKRLEKEARSALQSKYEGITGIHAFTHPYGCSQLGDDHEFTRVILAGLAANPNAAGVLVLGLGCENNTLKSFMPLLENLNKPVKAFNVQDVCDETDEGLALIEELCSLCCKAERTEIPVSELKIGYKCGGSDAFSGITANPLCGRLTDLLTSMGGTCVLTETPEMFGAETILMNRSCTFDVFEAQTKMINGFKEYFTSYGQPIYENPSPGNKEGGLTTLEEKSLGCIQKGGTAPVADVLSYGERIKKRGLTLLNGPGNDIVSSTALTAAGVHMIIFTTGRGTPLGAPVPTIKMSTNTALYEKKPNWIDFNAGTLLEGDDFDKKLRELLDFVISVASGRQTNNEINDYREIAIWKNGVTL